MQGVTGLDDLDRNIDDLLNIDTVSGLRDGAEIILRYAQDLVPVDTGELRDSGEVREDGEEVSVIFTADHAAPVEYGTSRMAAQPYLRPAIDEHEDEVVRKIKDKLVDEIQARIR